MTIVAFYLSRTEKEEEELISVSKCQSRKCDHNPKWIIKLLRLLCFLSSELDFLSNGIYHYHKAFSSMEWGNYGIFHTWQGPKTGGSLVPLPVCIMFRKIVTYDPKGSCGQEMETYPNWEEKPPNLSPLLRRRPHLICRSL